MTDQSNLTDLAERGLLLACLKNLAEDLDIELRPNAADRVREAIAEIERLRKALERAGEAIHGEYCGDHHHVECEAIDAALEEVSRG